MNNGCFENTGCIDTGSHLNLMPKSLVDIHNSSLRPYKGTISGIENQTLPILGIFECTVAFQGGFIRNIPFHIIDSQIPII